jgi:hypothetical protein
MSSAQRVRGAKNFQAGGHIIQNLTINIYVSKNTKDTAAQDTKPSNQK